MSNNYLPSLFTSLVGCTVSQLKFLMSLAVFWKFFARWQLVSSYAVNADSFIKNCYEYSLY
jgi:hypothetical protein